MTHVLARFHEMTLRASFDRSHRKCTGPRVGLPHQSPSLPQRPTKFCLHFLQRCFAAGELMTRSFMATKAVDHGREKVDTLGLRENLGSLDGEWTFSQKATGQRR